MSQVTHSVRAILSNVKVYDFFQRIMDAKRGRSIFSSRYLKSKNGDYVLDIGCGTAEISQFLSNVEYLGIDPNPDYIEAAKKRFPDRPRYKFLCATVDAVVLDALPKFDIVLASAVLHHLSDAEVIRLATLAKTALKENGRLVTIDPCLVEGQSPVARFFISRDRGRHVRDAPGYRTLMSRVFHSITADVCYDLARLPYTHLAMECMSK